jgi:UDP-glucuronate 4-epimerase
LKIIITGVAGFIGYHLCRSLLNEDYQILGIDNLNNYYDHNLKIDRLKLLKNHNNFIYKKIDISDREYVAKIFKNFKPDKVVNLAAQAGVRYSIENPYAYIDSNIIGFMNLIEISQQNNVNGFIYASSSSVYGGNKKLPFSENDMSSNPISLYGASKKSNELIANSYSSLYGLNTTGLRYFTVYGPWGRPDMAYFTFTKKILAEEPIEVYNNGKMKRDFTFIDDIILGTKSAIEKNYKCEIFNLGNNKNEELMYLIKVLENELSKEAIIEFLPMQPGDVIETYANIDKSIEKLNYKPKTSIHDGIPKFIDWFKNYYNK